MTNSRRDLLRGITGTAAAPALFALSDQLLQAAPGPDDDQAVAEFWNRQVRLAPPKSRGKGPRPASFNREPTYLFSHKEKGIQVATQMDEEGLPNSGNMEMELIVRGHRLSREDQEIFDDMKTGTLRLDVGQSKPFREVGDLLAWSIVAGLSPSGGDQDKANRAISDYTARSAQSPTPPRQCDRETARWIGLGHAELLHEEEGERVGFAVECIPEIERSIPSHAGTAWHRASRLARLG